MDKSTTEEEKSNTEGGIIMIGDGQKPNTQNGQSKKHKQEENSSLPPKKRRRTIESANTPDLPEPLSTHPFTHVGLALTPTPSMPPGPTQLTSPPVWEFRQRAPAKRTPCVILPKLPNDEKIKDRQAVKSFLQAKQTLEKLTEAAQNIPMTMRTVPHPCLMVFPNGAYGVPTPIVANRPLTPPSQPENSQPITPFLIIHTAPHFPGPSDSPMVPHPAPTNDEDRDKPF